MKRILSVLLAITCFHHIALHGMFSRLQAYFFAIEQQWYGTQDADKEHSKTTRQALAFMGVQHPENIPVKKLSPPKEKSFLTLLTGDLEAYNGLATMSGIWLLHPSKGQKSNDIVWEITNNKLRIDLVCSSKFTCYHEASHWKLNHPFKGSVFKSLVLLTTMFIITTSTYYGLSLFDLTRHFPLNIRQLLSCVFSLLPSIKIAKLCSSFFDRMLEKQADLLATKTLYETYQEDAIEDYLKMLDKVLKIHAETLADQYDDDRAPDEPAILTEYIRNQTVKEIKEVLQNEKTPFFSSNDHYSPAEQIIYIREYLKKLS